MRRIHVSLLAIALCALLMSPALTAAQSTIDKVTSATVKEKDAAVAHGKKLVGDMDVQIKALETQVSKDTSSAKADGQRQLNDLKAKRAATGKKLDELGKASEQNWDTTKKGFADAFTDLQKSFEQVASNIKK
jgi:hypothetical protein